MLKVELLTHTPNPDSVVTMAGKLCYSPVGINEIKQNLTDKEVKKFVNMLVNLKHESPLEHVSFTFGIEGVSRITEIQLIRHRIGTSYSIQSGRYVKRNDASFVKPPRIKNNSLASKCFDKIVDESNKTYNDIFLILMLELIGYDEEVVEMLSEGERIDIVANFLDSDTKKYKEYEKMCIEDARYAHLQSLETKIMTTINARELLHIFSKRTCNRSQWEIRQMADKMLELVREVAPNLFKFAGASCTYGKCTEGSMTCKNPRIDLRI